MKCKIYCWNARGEIYLNPVFIFITQVSWRAQREIFACAGGAVCSQRCQISVPGARAAVLTTLGAPLSSLSTLRPSAAAVGALALALLSDVSSALLELPPGELSASLTAVTRLCTLARASLMKWAQLPQKKGEVG